MVQHKGAHKLTAKAAKAPKTQSTRSRKFKTQEAHPKEDQYAKVYSRPRGVRAERKTFCEPQVNEDEKDIEDIKEVKPVLHKEAARAAALLQSAMEAAFVPTCIEGPCGPAPDTTPVPQQEVQHEVKPETPIPAGQPGCVADHPAWDELQDLLLQKTHINWVDDCDTSCGSEEGHTADQPDTAQGTTVDEGQAAHTVEGGYTHTQQYEYVQQNGYIQQGGYIQEGYIQQGGYMPMQASEQTDETPVDEFNMAEFSDFGSDYTFSEDEA